MGSQWVEDPSWGNIFSSAVTDIQAAPGKALSNIAQAEQIKAARTKAVRDQQLWDMGITTGNAYEKTLPRVAPPTDYTAIGPMVGDVNNPADTQGIPTADLQYQDPRAQAQFDANRALAVATARQAAAKGETSQIMPMEAYGTVATSGVPADATERARLQFLTTGKFPTGEEKAAPPAHNLAVIGPDGQPTGVVIATQDFKRDIQGRPIGAQLKPGETIVATGPASTTPSNPFESEAVALRGLNDIEARRQKLGHLTTEDATLASRLFDVAHPLTRVTESEGGRPVEKQVRAKPIPDSLMPLYMRVEDFNKGVHNQPPVATVPGAPAPIVPPTAIVNPNATRVTATGAANPAEVRKEYLNTQQVSDWNTTVPVFNSAVQSAQAPSNQQDINIIYAFAKLMDPGSVVRESEIKLASGSGTVLDTIGGLFQKLTTGGGTMTPEVRLAIIDTLQNRMGQYKEGKDMIDRYYREKVAPAAGLNPDEVIPPTAQPIPYNRDDVIRSGNQQRSQAPTAAPASPTVKRANEILGR